MKVSKDRERILSRIRQAIQSNPVEKPFPTADIIPVKDVFEKKDLSLAEIYAGEFIQLGGKFVYCSDLPDMLVQLNQLADSLGWTDIFVKDHFLLNFFLQNQIDWIHNKKDLDHVQAGMSLCECLIARTGSTLFSSAQEYGRQLPVYSPIHICIAFTSQIVWDIEDAFDLMKKKYGNTLPSMISLTSGASRTADIEKTLVVGIHGPKEVYTFLIEDQLSGQ